MATPTSETKSSGTPERRIYTHYSTSTKRNADFVIYTKYAELSGSRHEAKAKEEKNKKN